MSSSSPDIQIVRTVADLRRVISGWRAEGLSVGLVPTMGALHAGHFSLVQASVEGLDRTCVTLFVNPKQFGPEEDFDVYPRNEGEDAAALTVRGADLLFAPALEEMYQPGSVTSVAVPGIGDILEGACRPGFFTGVATVVTKLLIQALPDAAFFGEKDYQQLCVIRRLAADLDLPVDIRGCPIVREEDGLALSSRNAYLSTDERRIAPALNEVLRHTDQRLAEGEKLDAALKLGEQFLLDRGFSSVDYIAVRDPETLQPPETAASPRRLLGAAWLGRTRLIDNIATGA